MSKHELMASLEQLRSDLNQAKPTDAETRKLIDQLRADVDAALEAASPDEPPAPVLQQNLLAAVRRLEDAHPGLALTIGRVLDHLANA